MAWNWKTLVYPYLIGAVILIIGIGLTTYTNSVVDGIQETLRQGGLSQAQRDYFQGMLDWWVLNKITFYNPIAYLLTITGVIVVIFSIFYSLFVILHESKTS